MYDKKIIYLDYMESGVKVKNVGHVKLLLRQDVMTLDLHIRGLYETDTLLTELTGIAGQNEAVLGRLCIDRGNCYYNGVYPMNDVDGNGLGAQELCGIRIRLSDSRFVEASWHNEKEGGAGNEAPSLFREPQEHGAQAFPQAEAADRDKQKGRTEVWVCPGENAEAETAAASEGNKQAVRGAVQPKERLAGAGGTDRQREDAAAGDGIARPEEAAAREGTDRQKETAAGGEAAVRTGGRIRPGWRAAHAGDRGSYAEHERQPAGLHWRRQPKQAAVQGVKAGESRMDGIADGKDHAAIGKPAFTDVQDASTAAHGTEERQDEAKAYAESGPFEAEKLYEDKWSQLCHTYQVVHPFGEEEYIRLAPKDFVILRQEYQQLVNNSFLLHGYYNYKHLILGKAEGDKEGCYYLGVPGTFYEREKMVAVMFGFEGFESADETIDSGTFGYYMRRVRI